MIKLVIFVFTFICSSVLCAISSGFLFGPITKITSLVSILFGVLIGIKAILDSSKIKFKFYLNELSLWSKFVFICFFVYCLRSFLLLIFKSGDDLRVISPYNLGDIALHMSFINYIAQGPSFWLESSLLSGESLRYYIGIDCFNSLLLLLGVDIYNGLKIVGIICSLLAGFMLYVWGGAFTLAGFLFNGGLGALEFFHRFDPNDYQFSLAWNCLVPAVLIPQRAMVYSVPVGLLILSSFRNRFFPDDTFCKQNKNNLILPFWIEVLFYSSMPIFHFHTFIFFTLFFMWYLIFFKEFRKHLFKLLVFSAPLAIFLVLLLTGNGKAGSMIHIHWGWMQNKENFFIFWLKNFGIALPLFIYLFLKIIYEKRKVTQSLIIPGFLMLIVFFNLMFVAYIWDNIKLIIWAYVLLLPSLWSELIVKLKPYQKTVICILFLFSGFISLFGGFYVTPKPPLVKYSVLFSVQNAVKHLNIKDRFACAPKFNNPVVLAGRKVVIGDAKWLRSHGYKLNDKEEKLRLLMLGDKNWKAYVKDLNVKYIYWGEMEESMFPYSRKPWINDSKILASGSWGAIFEVE